MTNASILDALGPVTRLDECVGIVPDDYGEVVRGARTLTPEDRESLREALILRLLTDYARRTR